MREIRTLGAMRRGLETDLRFDNEALPEETGSKQDRPDLRSTAPVLDPTKNSLHPA